MAVGSMTLTGPTERAILACYGLMLLTTAMGVDFVYRGLERMGLVAASLCVRTAIYASGAGFWVDGPVADRLVPACLVAGEACGISLVWACYIREFGWPRPSLGGQFAARGAAARAAGVPDPDVAGGHRVGRLAGRGAAEPMGGSRDLQRPAPDAMVFLTFGLIVQQVIFPALARSWRGARRRPAGA